MPGGRSNVRPTYLLVESECDGLSSRKLVLETLLKHNVLLANTADEAQTTLHVFPHVDGVIVHSDIPDSTTLVSWIRAGYPNKYVVFLGEPTRQSCKEASIVMTPHDPAELLAALAVEYGTSRAINMRAGLVDDLTRTLRRLREGAEYRIS